MNMTLKQAQHTWQSQWKDRITKETRRKCYYFACIHSQNKQKWSSLQLRSSEERSRDFSSTAKCAWFFPHPLIFLLFSLVSWNVPLRTKSSWSLLINLRLILRSGEGLSRSLANIAGRSVNRPRRISHAVILIHWSSIVICFCQMMLDPCEVGKWVIMVLVHFP